MTIHQAFQVLGVAPNDPDLEQSAKKAFRKLSKKFHPDKNSHKDAKEKFNQTQEAYEVVKDFLKNPQQIIPFQIQQAAQILGVDPLSAYLENDTKTAFLTIEDQIHPIRTGNPHACDQYIQVVQATCILLDYVKNPQNYAQPPVNWQHHTVNTHGHGPKVHQTVDQHGNVTIHFGM